MTRNSFLNNICFIILLILAFYGCSKPTEEKNILVRTAVAENQKLTTSVTLTGVLLPSQTADISSRISGQVKSVKPEVGSHVKKGDVLVILETDILNAQLMQAESNLNSAEAATQVVQSQIDLAKINLDAVQKSYDRIKKLYDSGTASQSQLDDLSDKLETALRQYKNVSGPTLRQAYAAIDTAKASIRNLQVQIGGAVIKSPINGIVTNRNADPGEVVSPGITLLSIADIEVLKMKSSISQDLLPLLKIGQEIEVIVDIYPDRRIKGTLSSIGPIAFNTGRIFPIEISIENDGSILSGLSTHATLNLIGKQNVVVPIASVVESSEESHVFIIRDGIAEKRFVTTGLRNEHELEILDGVKPGELVAVTNVRALTDNLPVDIQ